MKYIGAKEARKILGNIHPNTLKGYVDADILNKYYPPGRKQWKYSLEEVLALAEARREYYGDSGKDEPHGGTTANYTFSSASTGSE